MSNPQGHNGVTIGDLCPRVNSRMPIREATELEWAWATGVYEGEGCVRKNGNSLQVRISQKDPEILHRLQQFTGGSVNQHKDHNSYIHSLDLAGDNARRFIRRTFNLLSGRRQDQIVRVVPVEEC